MKNICEDNGLNFLVNSPTRITNNSSTLIDLCLSDINKNKINCDVSSDDQISDHALLNINIIGHSDNIVNKKRKIRVWKDYNEIDLWYSIENSLHTWIDVENSDVNAKMNWFIDTMKSATNQFNETKTISTNRDFFDSELESMRQEKNRLYKMAQLSTINTDSNENWHKYRLFKNEYKKAIQIKRYQFNQEKLNRVQGDSKGTWKVLNSILNKENNEITRIKINEIDIDNDIEITNNFNSYFINSVVELNQNIPHIQFEDDIPSNPEWQFEFRNVSIIEIKKCLRELKNNTDEFFIKPSVLLDAVYVIGQQLVNIINQSFETGVFPEILKKSTIVPIQKKPGSILINDHRPINTLPCCERLIESLAYAQFNDYINRNQILNINQSGFRSQHSCETAINDVIDIWKAAQNESKVIIAVFLDFQRAFETIDTNILTTKLSKYGVRNSSLEWFNSYLTDRKQVVKLRETVSDKLDNRLGVPQGSILGPLIFILYINDIPNCLKYCHAKLFADDALVFNISDTIEEATAKINHDLDLIYTKLCQNKLKLNVTKTKVMIITNKKIDRSNINIYINGTRLDIENEIKYLGVVIDDKLNFEKNINNVCKKVGQKVNVMNRLRNELNFNQKLTLYKAIIEPHFNYCASILFISNVTDLNRLQILQNKCLRQILRANNYTESQFMLRELNLMSVVQLINFRTLILIYKIVNGQAPSYLTDRIVYKNANHNLVLRNSNEICLTNMIKSCSQNSLFYKGIKLFNSLPNEIKNQNTITKYQNSLKNYIKQNL